ncbi:uncharacterized protein LOC117628941 [Prunus dulcis]|uniref:uncharacterized protein LOC117628941 n=1 Tax=Prunus dulcis TaxID=3755 RepID=UPI0014823FDE|nr:uncharacterized protein LOC117628941 [Prunus dulcis]
MGIMGSSFSFILGSVFDIYVAQNYNIPNIQKLSTTSLLITKHIEETYWKLKKRDDKNQNQYISLYDVVPKQFLVKQATCLVLNANVCSMIEFSTIY